MTSCGLPARAISGGSSGYWARMASSSRLYEPDPRASLEQPPWGNAFLVCRADGPPLSSRKRIAPGFPGENAFGSLATVPSIWVIPSHHQLGPVVCHTASAHQNYRLYRIWMILLTSECRVNAMSLFLCPSTTLPALLRRCRRRALGTDSMKIWHSDDAFPISSPPVFAGWWSMFTGTRDEACGACAQ